MSPPRYSLRTCGSARWGVPKGLAILSIYFLFLLTIALLGLFVGPTLFDQISTFAASLPEQYEQFVLSLQSSSHTFLQQIGFRLPSFSTITQQLSARMPHLCPICYNSLRVRRVFLPTSSWCWRSALLLDHEISLQWERVVVSLAPTTRREQILAMWHEIEYKLGGFIRGQGLAMLVIGFGIGGGLLADWLAEWRPCWPSSRGCSKPFL